MIQRISIPRNSSQFQETQPNSQKEIFKRKEKEKEKENFPKVKNFFSKEPEQKRKEKKKKIKRSKGLIFFIPKMRTRALLASMKGAVGMLPCSSTGTSSKRTGMRWKKFLDSDILAQFDSREERKVEEELKEEKWIGRELRKQRVLIQRQQSAVWTVSLSLERMFTLSLSLWYSAASSEIAFLMACQMDACSARWVSLKSEHSSLVQATWSLRNLFPMKTPMETQKMLPSCSMKMTGQQVKARVSLVRGESRKFRKTWYSLILAVCQIKASWTPLSFSKKNDDVHLMTTDLNLDFDCRITLNIPVIWARDGQGGRLVFWVDPQLGVSRHLLRTQGACESLDLLPFKVLLC